MSSAGSQEQASASACGNTVASRARYPATDSSCTSRGMPSRVRSTTIRWSSFMSAALPAGRSPVDAPIRVI